MELVRRVRMRHRNRWAIMTASLAVVAAALCCAMLMLGNTIYPVRDVAAALLGEEVKGATFAVRTIRLPRMLAGLFAGFAFGVSGYVFQTMLRNPLANPNVIGITAGSSAAAVFCIVVLQAGKSVTSTAAVIAGLLTVLVIYGLARGRTFSIGRMILVGIGIQAMCNSAITYLLLIAREYNLPAAVRWLTGSLNGIRMEELSWLIASVLVFTPVIVFLSRPLQVLELGEQAAVSLGVRTDRTRVALAIGAVVLSAVATAVTGPIAAVAFLAGPIAVRLAGTARANVIPAGLVGAALVLAADLTGQFAFPVKFPVGILTGIIGAPYLLYLIVRMNRKGEL